MSTSTATMFTYVRNQVIQMVKPLTDAYKDEYTGLSVPITLTADYPDDDVPAPGPLIHVAVDAGGMGPKGMGMGAMGMDDARGMFRYAWFADRSKIIFEIYASKDPIRRNIADYLQFAVASASGPNSQGVIIPQLMIEQLRNNFCDPRTDPTWDPIEYVPLDRSMPRPVGLPWVAICRLNVDIQIPWEVSPIIVAGGTLNQSHTSPSGQTYTDPPIPI